MKQLHLLHIIALIVLFCTGGYLIGEIEQRTRVVVGDFAFVSEGTQHTKIQLTRLAAFAGVVVFAFSMVVGLRVRQERKILGSIWALVAMGAVVWMGVMWSSPTHISLVEVFPFWLLYVILGSVCSAYCIATWKAGVYAYSDNYEEELLDN